VATLPYLTPVLNKVAGIASLNYRLSHYSNHSSDQSDGDDPARNATHPDHIQDVMTAVAWLQQKYHFNENYLLVGHSAGATLAMQAVMGIWKPCALSGEGPSPAFTPPSAIAGIEGIYDLEALVESFHDIPIYRDFVEGAFGKDRLSWKQASPVYGKFSESWSNGRVVVLAQSKDDELVDFLQTEKMSNQLWNEKRAGRRDTVISLRGKHDEVWSNGSELSKVIIKALGMLNA
jgi:kynurenine formamidase